MHEIRFISVVLYYESNHLSFSVKFQNTEAPSNESQARHRTRFIGPPILFLEDFKFWENTQSRDQVWISSFIVVQSWRCTLKPRQIMVYSTGLNIHRRIKWLTPSCFLGIGWTRAVISVFPLRLSFHWIWQYAIDIFSWQASRFADS